MKRREPRRRGITSDAWRRFGAASSLACLALVAAATAGGAASAAVQRSVVVRESIARPGIYKVSVGVSTRSSTRNEVRLEIGGLKRYAVTAGRHRHTTLSLLVRVKGASLTVVAVGRALRPSLTISVRRIANLARPALPSPSGTWTGSTSSGGSASPTGPSGSTGSATSSGTSKPPPISNWAPANSINFVPLADSVAAANVIPMPETRPGNANYNANMPTPTQLQAFYGATDHWGHSILTDNPYYRYVTGQYQGSTDEIIQWTAWKWGIPENVLRAQYVQESFWHQTMLGDLMTVSQSAYYQYPPQARVPVSNSVYQVYATMGISQVKWSPDGLYGAGTEPLRWQSTAFAADYEAATIRFYFDDPGGLRTAWGDPGYQSAQGWNSVGGWFESYPWMNSGQATYIGQVQGRYNSQTWTSF